MCYFIFLSGWQDIIYENHADSFRLLDFTDAPDLLIELKIYVDDRYLGIGFNDSVVGHAGCTWQFYTNLDDPDTEIIESQLFNDSIILSFKQTIFDVGSMKAFPITIVIANK